MDYYHRLHHTKKKLPLNFDVLIPFLRFEKELVNELLLLQKEIVFKNDKFIITENLNQKPIWAQEWLPNCKLVSFDNKFAAVKILKSFKNLGAYIETDINAKLGSAIKQELRELKKKRISFEVPSKFNFKYFVWGLYDENNLFVCETPASRFPLGWHEFEEDKNTPPNRAYLKLWEVLCLDYIKLNPNDVAIDVGSSPGGWSWALSHYVKKVYSIDKAPLDKKIINSCPNIIYKSDDAFALNPKDYADCTWLFSDIICTPTKLLGLVQSWLTGSDVKNYVCTIKFKGDCDFDILKEFKKIPNSTIIHLYQNKNEVTWIKRAKK